MGQGDGRDATGSGATLRGRVGGSVDAHGAARVPQGRGGEEVGVFLFFPAVPLGVRRSFQGL